MSRPSGNSSEDRVSDGTPERLEFERTLYYEMRIVRECSLSTVPYYHDRFTNYILNETVNLLLHTSY